MNLKYCILSIAFLFSCNIEKNEMMVKEVDVCVYGGTSAGVVAAYSAKKMGKSVVLIEPGKYIGGMTTGGLGATDIGNKYAVTGLARLFYRRIGEHYNKFEQWMFPPSVATKVMQRFVDDADIDVLYNRRLVTSNVEQNAIKSIILESSNKILDEKLLKVKAKQFIDCTYEGDLMAKSGVSYTLGREDNSVYGETLNGVQMSIYHQFPDGVNPYKIEGDSTSGYCWGISNNELKATGSGDKLIQAYNFRLCLTDNPDNKRAFEKPENYNPEMYELLARAIRKMDTDINKYLLMPSGIPEQKYDANNKGPLSTDMIGMNYDYPEADYDTRQKIWDAHVDYTKGLLYFLSHDERVPEDLRNKVNHFGWAKDEFVDNDNFPTQLYVREARRMIGEYVMTQKNCQGVEIVDDAVGMAAYTMDSHNCQRIVVNGMVKNEGDVEVGGFPPYPISYRSLVPKRNECTNLLVPVCLSASHIAYGSIRMEPVFMVLGQSAGVASVLAIDNNNIIQDVDVAQLQNILVEDPYLDGSTPEILVDDSDSLYVEFSGKWENKNGYGSYKSGYRYICNFDNSVVLFKPQIKKSGKYEIYFFCPDLSDTEMPDYLILNINSKDGLIQKKIYPKDNRNSWISLGIFECENGTTSYVSIKGSNSNSRVFADAILWVPQ